MCRADEARGPSKVDLHAARNKTVADVIAPGLKVLFVGINPGLYSAAVGHHFARPGNRFWPLLHAAGFSSRLLPAFEERELLSFGYGITNVVARATAAASELSTQELLRGGGRLARKVVRYRPLIVAVLGVGAYRAAFNRPKALTGEQPHRLGEALLWVLPNPSGLNAHYRFEDLARMFKDLRIAVAADPPPIP
jgi:TDG/mug DNA glycosylase family protein